MEFRQPEGVLVLCVSPKAAQESGEGGRAGGQCLGAIFQRQQKMELQCLGEEDGAGSFFNKESLGFNSPLGIHVFSTFSCLSDTGFDYYQ